MSPLLAKCTSVSLVPNEQGQTDLYESSFRVIEAEGGLMPYEFICQEWGVPVRPKPYAKQSGIVKSSLSSWRFLPLNPAFLLVGPLSRGEP